MYSAMGNLQCHDRFSLSPDLRGTLSEYLPLKPSTLQPCLIMMRLRASGIFWGFTARKLIENQSLCPLPRHFVGEARFLHHA